MRKKQGFAIIELFIVAVIVGLVGIFALKEIWNIKDLAESLEAPRIVKMIADEAWLYRMQAGVFPARATDTIDPNWIVPASLGMAKPRGDMHFYYYWNGFGKTGGQAIGVSSKPILPWLFRKYSVLYTIEFSKSPLLALPDGSPWPPQDAADGWYIYYMKAKGDGSFEPNW